MSTISIRLPCHFILSHKLASVSHCINDFETLQQCLTNAHQCLSILYSNATEFNLQTDASKIGLEAVLEQVRHPTDNCLVLMQGDL